MRLIDADALMDEIKNRCIMPDWCKTLVRSVVLSLPTIEPKKGKWIYGENKYGHDGWRCDQCGHWILWDYHVSMEDAERDLPKYCPNCGALNEG